MKQLAWYLELPGIDGVAYVRQSMKRPEEFVLTHRRYIGPESEDPHFLWRVFQPLLERYRSESLVVGWLADAFIHMGYTMPNAKIGDLHSSDAATRNAARQNIKKLWQPMRSQAENLGWKSGSGSTHEVYLEHHPTSSVKTVWINPLHYTRLVVRFTPTKERDGQRLFDALRDLVPQLTAEVPLAHQPEIAIGLQRRTLGPETVVQVTSSLSDVVGEVDEVTEIERRLSAFVVRMLEAVPSAQ